MHFDWWTFALQVVNFAILVWLLNRFLYKPVLGMIDARRAEIDRQLAKAKAAEDDAAAQRKQVDAERAKIAGEREQAVKAAAAEAAETARARLAQAQSQAQALMDDTRKTLAREREQTKSELQEFALDLAADMARKLVAELPADKRAEAWLERIDAYLNQLPASEKAALSAQAARGKVEVVTAAPLSPSATEPWRQQLRQVLGDAASVTFAVDQRLIAGVELHFPETIVRFSLQDAIERLRHEVEPHGKAAQ